MIQECRQPFVSSNIDKGEAWFQAITSELRESKVGIAFITPQNLREEWIHLEAGAIYAALDKRLCPVFVNVAKADYRGPLRNLQLTEADDKSDMWRLVQTLKANCDSPLAHDVLGASFENWWPRLESDLAEAMSKHGESEPEPERSEADKLDELLLMVRELSRTGLGVGPGEAPHSHASTVKRISELEASLRVGGMALFRATFPDAEFAYRDEEALGRVISAVPSGDGDFQLEIAPAFRVDSNNKTIRARASELTFGPRP